MQRVVQFIMHVSFHLLIHSAIIYQNGGQRLHLLEKIKSTEYYLFMYPINTILFSILS